jgi:hypothetical protein
MPVMYVHPLTIVRKVDTDLLDAKDAVGATPKLRTTMGLVSVEPKRVPHCPCSVVDLAIPVFMIGSIKCEVINLSEACRITLAGHSVGMACELRWAAKVIYNADMASKCFHCTGHSHKHAENYHHSC